ncbi:MAG: hypothetical protein E7543_07670 [Ruminococcaceae bacterium]|nr:hypothetical protein [Oscillospiraceae bacterium]
MITAFSDSVTNIEGGSFSGRFSIYGGEFTISAGTFPQGIDIWDSEVYDLESLLADGCAFFDSDGNVVSLNGLTQYDEALAAKAHSHSGGTQTCKGYKCELCEQWYGEANDNHTGGEATCTEKAVCENCGAEYGEFDAENHDIIIDEAVAPTCTETGLTEGSHCSRCDDMTVAQEGIPAKGHEDTNGADNYKLQQITDYNIINMDIGALNLKESTDSITNTTTYSSDKFTGVAEIYMNNIKGNRFDITINHAQVNSGNFKIVLVHNDEIVHEFKLNELMQSYTLENPNGTVALRIAGESADFMFDYYLY